MEVTISIGRKPPSPTRAHKGKSLLSFPSSYVVLDTETTGLDPRFNEIIELAGVRFEDGVETARFQSLVRPEEEIDEFITALTGITNEMVRYAPSLANVLPAFLSFVGDSTIVGHNANFDVNFLYDGAESLGLPPFSNDFVDTMRISRRLYPEMKHHTLSALIASLGVGDTVEHRALSDCLQTQQCFAIMRAYAESIGGIPVNRKQKVKVRSKDITPKTEDFDPDSPVYGMTFVFTGALERMTRREAMQAVVNAGGTCKDSVSKKVNYLVLGNLDYANGIKGGKSAKQKAAEKLQLSGADIAVISENVFYDMLGNSFEFSDADSSVDSGEVQRDGITLSPEESAAVSAILSCCGDLASLIHMERRSQNYLTLAIPEDGLDFCRVKASPRTLWMSLDVWTGGFPLEDPRLAGVPNKNQRHWKISMSGIDEIANYADFIRLAAKSSLEFEGRYYEKLELEYLESIRSFLESAVESKGGPPDMISFRPTKADAKAGTFFDTALWRTIASVIPSKSKESSRSPFVEKTRTFLYFMHFSLHSSSVPQPGGQHHVFAYDPHLFAAHISRTSCSKGTFSTGIIPYS